MILLAYGLPKSASTFMAKLTALAVEEAGCDNQKLKSRLFTGELVSKLSFWSGPLDSLAVVAEQLQPAEHIVIKTHSPFAKVLMPLIESGKLATMITYRHIGDAALSAYEAGVHARTNGNYSQGFHRLKTHREAIDYIGKHFKSTTLAWLKWGGGAAYSYEKLTSSPEEVVAHLACLLQLDPNALRGNPDIQNLITGTTRTYNFNKGLSGRHLECFSRSDLDYMENAYGDINRFCQGLLELKNLF